MAEENIEIRTLYWHRGKDSNWELWEDLVPDIVGDDEVGRKFAYMGLEIGLQVWIDKSSGEAYATGIMDGDRLVQFEKNVKL